MSGYGVYIVELKGRTVRHAIASVYVGSSWLPPSERQKQHHEGHPTGARGLQGKTRRLRPELYLDLPWQPERADAVALERDRARRLRDAGFQVQSTAGISRHRSRAGAPSARPSWPLWRIA